MPVGPPKLASWSIAVALTAVFAAPVLADDPPPAKPAEATAKPKQEAQQEKRVCSTQAVTGSLVRQRVCKTEKQVKAEREATEDLVKERRELGGESLGERALPKR